MFVQNKGHQIMTKNRTKDVKIEYKLEFSENGILYYVTIDKKQRVDVRKCFPWSEDKRYFSLRNINNEELLLVDRLSELTEENANALILALDVSAFCFVIKDVLSISEDFELRVWMVDTEQGERCFQTQLMEWPRELPGGGLLIQDVAGDLYYVPKVESLGKKGRKLLWAFLD